jgi:hypothetical protein
MGLGTVENEFFFLILPKILDWEILLGTFGGIHVAGHTCIACPYSRKILCFGWTPHLYMYYFRWRHVLVIIFCTDNLESGVSIPGDLFPEGRRNEGRQNSTPHAACLFLSGA